MSTPLLSELEIIAVVSGVLNVALAARASNWNWLFGIVSTGLYIFIFYHVKLYADMGLQFFFLSMQGYGFYRWCLSNNQHKINISLAPKWVYGVLIFGGLGLYWLLHFILLHYTDSTTTHLDAITTAYSLLGQWMMSEKWIEHWYVWLFVDVLALQMYLTKSLYFTMGLYVCFIILCLLGLRHWHLQMKSKSPSTGKNFVSASTNFFM